MNESKKITQILAYCVSFCVIAVAYQNCGSFNSDGGTQNVSSVGNGDIVPLPNTKTTSIVRASRLEDNLVSCLGIGEKPNDSGGRNGRIATALGAVSEEGLANSMTQPMARSMATIAAEYCDIVVNRENGQTDAERIIFKGADFRDGGFGRGVASDAAKRLARSCWGRNITQEEIDTIVSDIETQFSDDTDNGNTTRRMALYMCTAMSSAFATFEM